MRWSDSYGEIYIWAQLPHGMWDLPKPEIEFMSLALAGGFLTTGPPEKPPIASLSAHFC